MENEKDKISERDFNKIWIHGFMCGFVIAMSLASLVLVFT